MWESDEFEYITEDNKGENILYVTINYLQGYSGNKVGSHDASYEDLANQYEIAKVEQEFIFSYDMNGNPVCDVVEIAIGDDMEKELIKYYVETQEALADAY